jgi:hypothetical protein
VLVLGVGAGALVTGPCGADIAVSLRYTKHGGTRSVCTRASDGRGCCLRRGLGRDHQRAQSSVAAVDGPFPPKRV